MVRLRHVEIGWLRDVKARQPQVGEPRYFALPHNDDADSSEVEFYPEPVDRMPYEQQVIEQAHKWKGWMLENARAKPWVPMKTISKQRVVRMHAAVYGDDELAMCEACGEAWPCYAVRNLAVVAGVLKGTDDAFGR